MATRNPNLFKTHLEHGPHLDRLREERQGRWAEISKLTKELEALKKAYKKQKKAIEKRIAKLDY